MMDAITRVLNAIEQGDPNAAAQLLPLVYDELRRLAAQRMAQEKPGQTLDATALVHEAYLRLVEGGRRGSPPPGWDSRGHFFAAAAEAMRRILVDQARRKLALRRGATSTANRSTAGRSRRLRPSRTSRRSTRRWSASRRSTPRRRRWSRCATSRG